MKSFPTPWIMVALAPCVIGSSPVWGVEHVQARLKGKDRQLSGKVLVTAQDGGLLLLAPDGAMWNIQPEEIVTHTKDDEPFEPLKADKLSKQLLTELPKDFNTHSTAHYLICYDTSKDYAIWVGGLYERLFRAFKNFWTNKGIKLQEPEFKLIVIVFSVQQDYLEYSKADLGKAGPSVLGYYSIMSNRVTMFDLTGLQSLRAPSSRRGSLNEINEMLSQPQAEQSVATIIHEATHQIAFNSGLQTRLADIPIWLAEGLAVYFEAPDLESSKGWRGIGNVNHSRLDRFSEYLPKRPANSLATLLTDSKRLREPDQALDGYAEAWALNYYLIQRHSKQYVAYLKTLAEKQPLIRDSADKQLKDFQDAFGDDLDKLDADFVKQTWKLK